MDDPRVSMYGIGKHLIYVGFASAHGGAAYKACHRLAAEHGLGFYDVSSGEGAVWLPDGKGGLTIAHKAARSP
jgi:hypothetical protein